VRKGGDVGRLEGEVIGWKVRFMYVHEQEALVTVTNLLSELSIGIENKPCLVIGNIWSSLFQNWSSMARGWPDIPSFLSSHRDALTDPDSSLLQPTFPTLPTPPPSSRPLRN
jgi:hypothetical protein